MRVSTPSIPADHATGKHIYTLTFVVMMRTYHSSHGATWVGRSGMQGGCLSVLEQLNASYLAGDEHMPRGEFSCSGEG